MKYFNVNQSDWKQGKKRKRKETSLNIIPKMKKLSKRKKSQKNEVKLNKKILNKKNKWNFHSLVVTLPFLLEIANSVLLAGIIIFHQYAPVTVISAVRAKKPDLRNFI